LGEEASLPRLDLCHSAFFVAKAFQLDRKPRGAGAPSPVGTRLGEISTQDFDRDLAMVLEIFGEVDCCHTAGAKLALDAVAVGEGSTRCQ